MLSVLSTSGREVAALGADEFTAMVESFGASVARRHQRYTPNGYCGENGYRIVGFWINTVKIKA